MSMLDRIIKSILYHAADAIYAIFPKRAVLKMYGGLTIALRAITWRLACRYYGPNVIRYRGDICDFVMSQIRSGDRVLDVGCAEGNLTRLMAKRAKSVTGIDIEKKYIDPIDKDAEDLKNVKFIIGDAFNTDFKENFDVTILVHAIEHLNESEKLLKRLSEFTHRIVIETPNAESDWICKLLGDLGVVDLGDEKHVELFSDDSLKKKLEDNGWRDVVTYKGYGVVRAVAHSKAFKNGR